MKNIMVVQIINRKELSHRLLSLLINVNLTNSETASFFLKNFDEIYYSKFLYNRIDYILQNSRKVYYIIKSAEKIFFKEGI